MTELYLHIALGLIVICNLGILRLFYVMQQDTFDTRRSVYDLHNNRIATILQRISQVKTRLADEERDDQREKRRANAKA